MERNGGYARGRATRQVVLAEALRLFGEVGYRSATLRELAARCGLSHPGLLHHFPSKAALLQAVLEERDVVEGARAGAVGATGVAHLRALLRIARASAAAPGLVELFAVLSAEAGAPDHPAHDFFVRRYARLRAELTTAFREAAEDGLLRPGVDPVSAAVLLTACWDGLQVQWLHDRDSVDVAAGLEAALRLLVDLDG
ncbi:TetR/AcrR family transcriptional regulator [Actinotalea sp. Marseille-Q4924]|uniref:TetR/AcrR family transcriptional regulator n=1 Tax=Actinotalea sp. Marseille-Q4924 TaxID=2866571 RepID=UPI001CE42987|nr:TetR/AcrR family transcriptional regulator [Actinotalea sp. Marseille-Q4924]